ncbi:MAG: hypothetical protein LBT85_01380 [Bifidobacteriaceae bacterium]|jgi:hypothetical protein|nr:hypothetical protein [Bifidobacteriaceae bacterium]
MKFIKIKKFALFIFPILFIALSFLSGTQFSSKSTASSEILPISRGGTGASTPAEASNNLLGENFTNYSETLPIEKGGTSQTNSFLAVDALGGYPSYEYKTGGSSPVYIKIASVQIMNTVSGMGNQTVVIAGMFDIGGLPIIAQLSVSGRNDSAVLVNYSPYCYDYGYEYWGHNFAVYSIDVEDPQTTSGLRRDFYAKGKLYMADTKIYFTTNNPQNSPFTPARLSSLPEEAKELNSYCLESQKVENL